MKTLHYNIKIRSDKRDIVSISNFNYTQNKITFLFGESGIGKTMISRAIFGLLDSRELQIEINTQPYEQYINSPATCAIKENGFFVFQEPSSHLNPLIKLNRQLDEGSLSKSVKRHGILRYLWNTQDDRQIKEILDIYPRPFRPSGGEKQRILSAMAFKKMDLWLRSEDGQESTLFIFDEPSGNLDDFHRNRFLKLLFKYFERKPFTALVITHDYSIIGELHRAYNSFAREIQLKELRQTPHGLELNEFTAGRYLSWLEKLEHFPAVSTKIRDHKDVVLRVDSQFMIFGRSYQIYRDSRHLKPGDLVIRAGEIAYLKAPSGVGKTTLAKIVMGLLPARKAALNICGFNLNEQTLKRFWQKNIWGKKAAMAFQHADEALNLQASVKDNFSGLPVEKRLAQSLITKNLQILFNGELNADFLKKKIKFLSGGQKQRLNLLRTLILDTDLIILDEPLNGLDFESIKKVLSFVIQKKREGKAILLISHNEEIFDAIIDDKDIFYLTHL